MRLIALSFVGALLMSPAVAVAGPPQITIGSQPQASVPAEQTVSVDIAGDLCVRHHKPGTDAVTVECHDPDAITCVQHARTGSRIVTSECHPRHVWDQMTVQGQSDAEDVQRRSHFLMGGM